MKNVTYLIWKPLIAVVFWGISFVSTKSLLDKYEPLTIIYIRLFLGMITVFLIALIRKRNFFLQAKDLKGIIILAAISTLHLWIQVSGMQYTTASNTGWIIGIVPVIMAIMGYLFYKETMTASQITGAVIAFSGLILLISKGDIGSVSLISNKGDLLVLGSAFTWSFYSFAGKKVTLNYPPSLTIFYLFATMFILLSPVTLQTSNINLLLTVDYNDAVNFVFLGVFCSGIAYVMWAKAMNELPAHKVGAFLYIEPFVTVFTAWYFLREDVTIVMMLSGIVIIIGVVLVNRN